MDPVGSIGEQIERLTKQAVAQVVKINDREYSTVPLYDPSKPEPTPAALVVATLSALVEFVGAGQDGEYLTERGAFVHVAGPCDVSLYTGLFGEHNQRAALVTAKHALTPFPFEQFMDSESFGIHVQTRIENTEDRAAVLALVGNLSTEAVQTIEDDGVSQSAKTRAGIVKVAERKVPNPVILSPFRTFAEVAQPSSAFILRLRGGGDGKLPMCGLFEADGGAWRLTAIDRIKTYLRGSLPATVRVYG